MFALGAGWEKFKWLQLIGFAILVTGTTTYNGLLPLPAFVTGAAAGDHASLVTCLLIPSGLARERLHGYSLTLGKPAATLLRTGNAERFLFSRLSLRVCEWSPLQGARRVHRPGETR